MSTFYSVCSSACAWSPRSVWFDQYPYGSSFAHTLLNPTDSPPPGSSFNLKVQVNDVLSRQQLSQAFVEIYVNYTRTHTVVTGEDGGVLLYVPHQAGASVTIVASKDGYISAQLPCKTNRLPSKIFIRFTRWMSTLSGCVMTKWTSSVG